MTSIRVKRGEGGTKVTCVKFHKLEIVHVTGQGEGEAAKKVGD